MVQCNTCGRFMSKDGVTCTQCKTIQHHACVRIPLGADSTTWKCDECQTKPPTGRNLPDNNIVMNTPPTSTKAPLENTERVNLDDTAHNITAEFNETELQLHMRAFKEEFLSEFCKMQRSLTTELKRVSEEIKELCSDMRDVRVEISEFRSSLKANQEKMTSIENRLTALESSQSPDSDSRALSKLEENIKNLTTELHNRDQISLLNDLEITGIPETQGENPIHIVSLLATKIGMSLDERDIVSAERIGAPTSIQTSTASTTTAAATAAGAAVIRQPRRIMIRFTRRTTRDKYLQSARVRRGITSDDIVSAAPPTRVYVNERLTKFNRQLFAKAREACRRKQWKYCWTRDGRVLVRKENGIPYVRITSDEDFDRVFGKDTV